MENSTFSDKYLYNIAHKIQKTYVQKIQKTHVHKNTGWFIVFNYFQHYFNYMVEGTCYYPEKTTDKSLKRYHKKYRKLI